MMEEYDGMETATTTSPRGRGGDMSTKQRASHVLYEVGSGRRNTLGVVVKAYPTAGKTAKGRPHVNNFRLRKRGLEKTPKKH